MTDCPFGKVKTSALNPTGYERIPCNPECELMTEFGVCAFKRLAQVIENVHH